MKPTCSAKVACEKEKADVSTKQTCHNKTNMSRRGQEVSHSRFCINVSRRVSVNCNSTFCSDVYLDYSVDSASLKVPITPKNVFRLVKSLYGIRKNAEKIFAFG